MTRDNWKNKVGIALLAGSWLACGNLYATEGFEMEDFGLRSGQDLVDVCTLPSTHTHHDVAVAFCYGFFEGAIHYANALDESGLHEELVCEPPDATRSQAVTVVVDYLTANPQYSSEPPIDAAFRALIDQWPCPGQKASCTACSE